MFTCATQGCQHLAEWEPAVVIVKSDEEVRVGVPAPVCTHHRRGLREVLLNHGIPAAETELAQRGFDLRSATFRIEFTALN